MVSLDVEVDRGAGHFVETFCSPLNRFWKVEYIRIGEEKRCKDERCCWTAAPHGHADA